MTSFLLDIWGGISFAVLNVEVGHGYIADGGQMVDSFVETHCQFYFKVSDNRVRIIFHTKY